MAKNSMVQRELKRSRLVAKYAEKRNELKQIIKSADATYDEKMAAVEKLQKLPRDSSAVRQPTQRRTRNVCVLSRLENQTRFSFLR